VNFQTAVVINETELSEPIHKEVNSRSRGADHFCQGFLAYSELRSPISLLCQSGPTAKEFRPTASQQS
jgi:hypothetical protein